MSLLLLAAWAGWFFAAELTIFETTASARLEAGRDPHPVEAPVSGRIVAHALVLGREVREGDLLVELDARSLELELDEKKRTLAGLRSQLAALREESAVRERGGVEQVRSGRAAVDELRAQYDEALAAAEFAEAQAERTERLFADGLVSRVALDEARSLAKQRRAAAESLRRALRREELEQRFESSEHRAGFDRLRSELARLEGEIAATTERIERLEYEIERRRVRAPVDGWLGEVAEVRVGSVVQEGDRLGTIVPEGELKVVAFFPPAAALGRIRPGQPARVRLEGFPWTQYGTLRARVTNVASEPRQQRVRVELGLAPDQRFPVLLQHGLPGSVEVEVDRVSPATLVLRAAGKVLGAPRGERAASSPIGGEPSTRR